MSWIGNCRDSGLLLLHCFWAALGPLQLDPPASAWSLFAVGKGSRKQLGLSLARASSLCWQLWSFSSWCCVGILGARQPEGRHCPRGYVWRQRLGSVTSAVITTGDNVRSWPCPGQGLSIRAVTCCACFNMLWITFIKQGFKTLSFCFFFPLVFKGISQL